MEQRLGKGEKCSNGLPSLPIGAFELIAIKSKVSPVDPPQAWSTAAEVAADNLGNRKLGI